MLCVRTRAVVELNRKPLRESKKLGAGAPGVKKPQTTQRILINHDRSKPKALPFVTLVATMSTITTATMIR